MRADDLDGGILQDNGITDPYTFKLVYAHNNQQALVDALLPLAECAI